MDDTSEADGKQAGHEGQFSDLAAQPGALLLDYLRVTLPDNAATRAQLAEWVGPSVRREVGWRGWYDISESVLDGGILAWCADPSKAAVEGLLVDLPGRACACLGAKLVPFLEWALSIGKASRVDFAIDDRAGRVTLDRIRAADQSGGIVTRFKHDPSYRLEGWAGEKGWTVYFGSRTGAACIRIYDKAAQQEQPGPWVRVELEAKAAFADALARAYFADGAEAVVGQITRRLRFAEPRNDSNHKRWPVSPWWEQFIGSVKPGPSLLPGERQETTVTALRAYVERQAGPALATIVKADGGDVAWVWSMLAHSVLRMKPKHLAALLAWGGMVYDDRTGGKVAESRGVGDPTGGKVETAGLSGAARSGGGASVDGPAVMGLLPGTSAQHGGAAPVVRHAYFAGL